MERQNTLHTFATANLSELTTDEMLTFIFS